MAIGGGKFWRYGVWVAKKKIQVFVRAHLSHVLALALAIMVIVRERGELLQIGRSPHHIGGFGLLVFAVTAGTIVAAIWEFFGNKLTTSPQEIRFLQGIRSLLYELEKFGYGKDRIADPQDRLVQFVEGFLEVACNTLCGHRHVDGALMVKDPNKDSLTLISSSKRARYPKDLDIPLPSNQEDGNSTGPAGWSFHRVQIVYVPKKKRHEAWPFRLIAEDGHERYEPSEPLKGWIPARKPDEEDYKSVLCVPLAIYQQKNQKRRFGVLNFTTGARDPFVDRDFMMAECFASILGHAFAMSQEEESS